MLLTDHFFAGADTLATTYAFATAIRKIGDWFSTPDIIFTGKQTIDGHTAQVGPDMARRLGLLQLTYVAKIAGLELTSRPVDAEPRAEGGVQGVHTNLPCLITRLELTNQICGGLDGRPPCAARAPVVNRARSKPASRTSRNAVPARLTDHQVDLCASPRAAKAVLVEAAKQPAEPLIERIFERKPKSEAYLAALVR